MKEVRVLAALVLAGAVVLLHFSTCWLHSDGSIQVGKRNFYFVSTSGKLFFGTMFLGDLGALYSSEPIFRIQREPVCLSYRTATPCQIPWKPNTSRRP